MDKKKRDELILRFAPLVKSIVTRMTAKLPIDGADKEALINVGIIGLMGALEKFDESRNVQFETYAKFRIRGAVLDELRLNDWVPRSVRDKDDKLVKAYHELEKKLGRAPTEEEAAAHLGVEMDEYYRLLTGAKAVTVISTEDVTADYIDYHTDGEWLQSVDQGNPLDLLTGEETRMRLKKAIDALPEKERVVMSLYYFEELTMKEIGCTLRLTESRVCQLHSQAVLRMRAALRYLRDEERPEKKDPLR
ncbi:MAG TPA: FliA/WhiG family RNA polymerase sigma factor [Syntrophales bacterium]|nr:FliA/WhiG family RNA polymerase sigma factor [Syntrophales bacterium]HQG35229.1 FliA/WhiG family RNA polymerase sigma factor [Syntrophales bacterium]HQI35572.1 FliA/WhiG family RNA polymerase sigma factor [Syntrophales bacterium]HQJ30405.1 FliA/WhiG family RNA polymerase sigma factor [Syntrophales bacterium]HRU88342.1 FliA/WhiG family RNA polymerase sigma factor [Syntrophales bacterium]